MLLQLSQQVKGGKTGAELEAAASTQLAVLLFFFFPLPCLFWIFLFLRGTVSSLSLSDTFAVFFLSLCDLLASPEEFGTVEENESADAVMGAEVVGGTVFGKTTSIISSAESPSSSTSDRGWWCWWGVS